MKKYDGLIAMGYFAVIFFFESLMFAIVSELPFFAGNNHREKILWYAINFLVLTVMAAVLQRIYKDVLWDSIKGVSKWYILKNVIVGFLAIESLSMISNLLINAYYTDSIKSSNQELYIRKRGILLLLLRYIH